MSYLRNNFERKCGKRFELSNARITSDCSACETFRFLSTQEFRNALSEGKHQIITCSRLCMIHFPSFLSLWQHKKSAKDVLERFSLTEIFSPNIECDNEENVDRNQQSEAVVTALSTQASSYLKASTYPWEKIETENRKFIFSSEKSQWIVKCFTTATINYRKFDVISHYVICILSVNAALWMVTWTVIPRKLRSISVTNIFLCYCQNKLPMKKNRNESEQIFMGQGRIKFHR